MTKEIIKKITNEYKEKTKKDCYEIIFNHEAKPRLKDNKIGGTPYFPKGEKYPIDKNGEPMYLLVQINLSTIELPNYPKNGFLEVFMSELLYPQEYKVYYFEDNLQQEENLPVIETSGFIIDKPYKIDLNKTIAYMPFADYRSNNIITEIVNKYCKEKITSFLDLDDDVIKHINEDIIEPYSTIGGYANFTQNDTRSEKDNRNECVLCLDSMSHKNLRIGDCGIITVTISEDNIKTKNFDKAVLDWDCC